MTLRVMGAEAEVFARPVPGTAAHAEGSNTLAAGSYSHAEGLSSTTSGQSAHAEGNTTTASGNYSHAEGGSTTASSNYAHAEGQGCNSSAACTHSEGYFSVSGAQYAHAGGYQGKADGLASWARGSAALAGLTGSTRAQVATYTLGAYTTTITAATMTFDASATITTSGINTNVLILPASSNYLFELTVTSRRPAATNWSTGVVYKGLIARESTGTARLVGTPTQVASWQDGSNGTVTIAANASNYLQVTVTAASAVATSWFGVLTTTELVAP